MSNDLVSRELGLQMQQAYNDVSAFIELHTSRVCPGCQKVCCIDRHGTHEIEDLAFIQSIGETPSPTEPLDDDTLPCRQLGEMGCGLKRWERPFRCTWYFCQALLDEMPEENPREYRVFIEKLRQLQQLRQQIWELCKVPRAPL